MSLHHVLNPCADVGVHFKTKSGVSIFVSLGFAVTLKPFVINGLSEKTSIDFLDHSLFTDGVEVCYDHATEFSESFADILLIDIAERKVNYVAFLLVFGRAVYSRNSLNGIDVADFLVEEKGVQLRFVEAGLQFVNDNDKAVLCGFEIVDNLILGHTVVHRRALLVFLGVGIYDSDRSIGILCESARCGLLGHETTNDFAIFDCNGDRGNGEHRLTLTTDFAVDLREKTADNEFGNSLAAFRILVDLLFGKSNLLVSA